MTICGVVWRYVAFLAFCGVLWRYVALLGVILALCDVIRRCLALCDDILPYVALRGVI